jgi:branched-subunit amino acid permease
MKPQQQSTNSKKFLMKYAGLATQIFVSLTIAAFLGYQADKFLKLSVPVLVVILPLLVLFVIFYKLFKETSKNKDDKTAK